jgi:hypothetical protein
MRILVKERANVPDVLPDGTDMKSYKRLAAAVLQVALSDANGTPASPHTLDARGFLSRNNPGGDGVKMTETASASEDPGAQADSVWYWIPPDSNIFARSTSVL